MVNGSDSRLPLVEVSNNIIKVRMGKTKRLDETQSDWREIQ